MAINIGDVFGDYRITGMLGRGGMGKVYRVRNLVTDREEAMKVALADVDDNPELTDRFQREIKVHASLIHPHIAALRTALRIEGRLVMIMELVEGASLEDILRNGPMPWPNAVTTISQVLSALAFAHERGVVHRDIKPANILITSAGEAKLTDFGIARPSTGTRMTGTGFAIGTPTYMSPEQLAGGPIDGRSDLYSLGLTLFEMLTGRVAQAHPGLAPPDPSTLVPALPRPLTNAILRAIRENPADRFQTAREFTAALPIAVGVPAALPTPIPTPTPKPTFDTGTLDRIARELAPYIGPIAKVVVTRTARSSSNPEELIRTLAAEISTPKERREFEARARAVL